MSNVKIYGIKACDTMKKAFTWLDDNGVSYDFHDYKKEGADVGVLKKAIAQHGWDVVINRRGTTWRKLPDDVKDGMDEAGAIKVAQDNPSIIKRPLVLNGDDVILGFDAESYKSALK